MKFMGKHSKPSQSNRIARDIFVGATGIGLMFVGTQYANASPNWDALAECETNGTWTYPVGYHSGGDNGYQGGLQFSASTWASFGGLEFAPTAGQATKEQQIIVAERVLATQGNRAWPGCSDKLPGWWENGGENVSPTPTPAPVVTTQVVRPTHGVFTSGYGSRWGTMHHGIDIANGIGTPIYAVANGEVISAGYADGFGQWVRIRHDSGNVTVYGHIDTYSVSVGKRVTAGQQIATMGNRGHSTGPHLHFEVWLGGTRESGASPTDPVAWLSGNGVDLTWGNTPLVVPSPAPAPAPEVIESAPIPTDNGVVLGGANGTVIEVRGDLAATYRIGEGDTLSNLSVRFGVTIDGVLELNPEIENPDLIYVGDDLKLMP